MTAWIEQWHHDIIDVSRLPVPQGIERPACMTGRLLPGVRRRVRQLAPRLALRDCCDYHGQDWALPLRDRHPASFAGQGRRRRW